MSQTEQLDAIWVQLRTQVAEAFRTAYEVDPPAGVTTSVMTKSRSTTFPEPSTVTVPVELQLPSPRGPEKVALKSSE